MLRSYRDAPTRVADHVMHCYAVNTAPNKHLLWAVALPIQQWTKHFPYFFIPLIRDQSPDTRSKVSFG